MKAKQFLKDRKLDKGRLTMHLNGADYSVDLQNLLEEYANQRVIDELEEHNNKVDYESRGGTGTITHIDTLTADEAAKLNNNK